MAADGRRPERGPATQQTAAPGGQDYGDRYRWVALAEPTLGILWPTLDWSIVLISLPAIFRGIRVDPLAPGNVGYLLWMIMGYLLCPPSWWSPWAAWATWSVGSDLQRGLRGLHRRHRWRCRSTRSGAAAEHVADRLAGGAGRRRVDADGQLGRDPHRRVPGPTGAGWRSASTRSPASPGSSSAWCSAACWPRWTGARCSGSTSRSASSARCGPTARCTSNGERRPATDRLVGNVTFAVGLSAAAGGDHVRHPALRRAHHGLDQPAGCWPG